MNHFSKVLAVLMLALPLTAQTSSKASAKKHAARAASTTPMPAVDKPTAVIDTTAGRMTCTLFPDKAPNAVANFVGLATGSKEWKNPKTGKTMRHVALYNGTIFHRVIPDFMIQGGDPLGNGTGDPGFAIADEYPDLKFDVAGRLAYANSGPNTNGSQFFITEVPVPHLDAPNHYVIFGQCDEATVALANQIARQPRDQSNDRPDNPVVIKKVTILNYKLGAVHHAAPRHSARKKPAVKQ